MHWYKSMSIKGEWVDNKQTIQTKEHTWHHLVLQGDVTKDMLKDAEGISRSIKMQCLVEQLALWCVVSHPPHAWRPRLWSWDACRLLVWCQFEIALLLRCVGIFDTMCVQVGLPWIAPMESLVNCKSCCLMNQGVWLDYHDVVRIKISPHELIPYKYSFR